MSGGRIRSLKPELLEDDRTASLSHVAFRFFVGAILLADDYGNLRGTLQLLDGQIYWGTDRPHGQAEIALRELVSAGLVKVYSVRGSPYVSIVGWSKHQKVDHPGKPRVPGPQDIDSTPTPGFSRESSRDSPEDSRESLAPDQDLRPPIRTSDPDQDLRSGPPHLSTRETLATDQLVLEPVEASSRERATAGVDQVVAHFIALHPRARPGRKERKLVADRMREGYSPADLCRAIDGNHRSPFHNGENDRGQAYHELELILRDSGHVAKFIELAEPRAIERLSKNGRSTAFAAQEWLREEGEID